jgi:hypothetical protein
MQKWEYLTVQFSDANPTHSTVVPQLVMGLINGENAIQGQPIHELVSKLGRQGWEMIGALSTEELFGHSLFFKRPATEQPTDPNDRS